MILLLELLISHNKETKELGILSCNIFPACYADIYFPASTCRFFTEIIHAFVVGEPCLDGL